MRFLKNIHAYSMMQDELNISVFIFILFLECSSLKQAGYSEDSVYSINPDGGEAIDVYCDMTDDAWIIIQRHIDDCGLYQGLG